MINTIELKNFKCFQDIKIELAPLTLFVGLNGAGKSTLIQALLLLRQSYLANVIDKGIMLNGVLTNIGTGKDLLYERAERPEIISIKLCREDSPFFEASYTYNPVSSFLHIRRVDHRGMKTSLISNCALFNDRFEYLCAERIGPRDTSPKSYYEVSEHKNLGIHGEYAHHYLLLFGADPSNPSARIESIDLQLKSQVQGWLSYISPGVRLEIIDYDKADMVSMQYRFVDNELSNFYRSSNVGFGITYTLPVILALLKSQPGDLVIIENPEAHLHPQGQRKMGELIARIASGGVQVIIETHSDHLLNGVRLSVKKHILSADDAKICFVEKCKGDNTYMHEISTPAIKPDGRLDSWPEGFFDEWDKALDELMED